MLSEIITSYEREVAIHFTILSHHGVVLLKLDDLSACLSLYKLKGLYFFILLSFSHLSWDSCTKAYGLSIQIEDVIGQKLHWCNWVKLSVIQLKSKQTFSFRLHTNVVVAGELNHQHWLEGNVIFQNHRRSISGHKWAFGSSLPPSLRGSAWAAPCGRRRAKHDTPAERTGKGGREHEERVEKEKSDGESGVSCLTWLLLFLSEELLPCLHQGRGGCCGGWSDHATSLQLGQTFRLATFRCSSTDPNFALPTPFIPDRVDFPPDNFSLQTSLAYKPVPRCKTFLNKRGCARLESGPLRYISR